MTRRPSRPRTRTALVTAVAGALVAGVTGTSASGAPAPDPRVEVLRSFAEQSRSRTTPADPAAGGRGQRAKDPMVASGASTTSAGADCASLAVIVTQTLDHNHISWQGDTGSSTFSVKRERNGGSATTIASALPADRTSLEDAGHNPLGSVAYHVSATVGGTTFTCRSPETGFWSMSTDTGTSYPDVFFAGDTAVHEQDTYYPAFPSYPATASRPAFSPTGRLVAAVEDVDGVSSITVRTASTGVRQWSVPSPEGTVLDEPAFSPDGQRIVAEALALPDLETSLGLYTVPVNAATHPLTLVPGSADLATPDWVDTPAALASTTIVAADLQPDGGLVLLDAATGARTALPGTAGALDPMGQVDGSVLFTTYSDTEATLVLRRADGTLQRIRSWADSTARWPVTDPNTGVVLVHLVEPDPSDPTRDVWSVSEVDPATGADAPTGVGLTRSGAGVGFHGFDLRTSFSAGTSDFGGAGYGDILARSSTGVLYAYPLSASSSSFFDARRQLGTGWGTMSQFLAAGDLNSDRRGDVVAIDSSGALWLYPGRGGFALGARTKLGAGWSSYAIFSTGDVDGDTRADLVARDSSGNLWLYPGDGAGKLLPRKQIGKGWQIFNAIVGPGDWNYDGHPDLLARDRANGYLYLYPGRGNAAFGTRKLLGTGWNARTAFAAPELYSDGLNALFARTSTGVLLDYDSVGDGVMKGSYQAGTGWNGYTLTG